MIPGQEYNKAKMVDQNVRVELMVTDTAEAILIHDKPFMKELSWLEYDINDSKLVLIMDDGDIRDFGIPVEPRLSRYLQNSHQVQIVEMPEIDGEAIEHGYLPLIIHHI